MTDREDDENPVIDRLVHEYVERVTASVDSSALKDRIFAERSLMSAAAATSFATSGSFENADGLVSSVKQREPVFRWPRFVSWWGVATLAVVLAFLCGRHFSEPAANASMVLQGVQLTHAQDRDYCYRVRFDPDPRYWNPTDKLGGPSLSRLWTRGDRFWADCAIGDITFKLGREANGTVWISPSQGKGIRFSNESGNLPKTVARICQINSMSVPRLMNEVLVDFDLNSRTTSDPSGGERTLVWAQLKPGRTDALLSHALLEIDTRTNILVRLVLWTVDEGKPRGTVAFTLLESATISDEQYELSSHLEPEALIEIHTLPVPDYEPDLTESPEIN